MVQRSEEVGDGAAREDGEVPDGLHSGVRLSDIPEHGRPGPEAQLQPLHGHEVLERCLPEGALALPQV